MGGSSSKATTDVATNFATSVIAKNIMKCGYSIIQNQNVNVSGNNNILDGISLNQSFRLNANCLQDSKAMAQMQNEIANAIQQAAKSSNVALIGALGKSDSEVDLNIRTQVSNAVNFQNIQEIVTQTNSQQGINVSGNNNILRNITLEQVGEMLLTNSQTVVNQIEAVNIVNNKIKQEATAIQENPLNVLTDVIKSWMDGLQGLGMIGAIIVIGALAVSAWVFINMFSGDDGSDRYRQSLEFYNRQQQMAPKNIST